MKSGDRPTWYCSPFGIKSPAVHALHVSVSPSVKRHLECQTTERRTANVYSSSAKRGALKGLHMGCVIFVIAIQTLTVGKLFQTPYLGGFFIHLISQTSTISKNKLSTIQS